VKNKKNVLTVLILVLIISISSYVSAVTTTLEAHVVDFSIYIDAWRQNFRLPIVTIDNTTYVPLREFIRGLGSFRQHDVEWNEENRSIHINRRDDRDIDVPWVSIARLLAHPEKYHEELVSVRGIFNIDSQDFFSIYFTRECWEYNVWSNALRIRFARFEEQTDTFLRYKELNGQLVHITGEFDKTDLGHFAFNSGTIIATDRIELLEQRRRLD